MHCNFEAEDYIKDVMKMLTVPVEANIWSTIDIHMPHYCL